MTFSCCLLLAFIGFTAASVRYRRQAVLAVNQQDIPITLRSLITCLTPGIRENLCLGPRVEVLRNEKVGLTERRGAAYGYVDGVDIGLLKPFNIPMIEDETEVGRHVGAVVDVTNRDGVAEFGDRLKVFKAFRLNNGGIAEWDRTGAGVDVGSRASAADDLVKLRWTLLGVGVGPSASRTIVGPGPTTLGRAKGAALKTYTPFPSFYRGYHERGDWYRNQFYQQVTSVFLVDLAPKSLERQNWTLNENDHNSKGEKYFHDKSILRLRLHRRLEERFKKSCREGT